MRTIAWVALVLAVVAPISAQQAQPTGPFAITYVNPADDPRQAAPPK